MNQQDKKNLLSNANLISGIGWIYLIAGIITLGIGVFLYFKGSENGFSGLNWGRILFHIGEILLVSVLLSSTVNAKRYIGAFKQDLDSILHSEAHTSELSGLLNKVINDEGTRDNYYGTLQRIIFGKEFVSIRKDVNDLWNNVTLELIKHKFPGIQRDLLDTLRVYFLEKENYYYKDHEIQYVVTWKDREKGIIETKESHTLKIVSDTKDPIKYDFSTRSCVKDKTIYKCEVPYKNITIDGVPCDEQALKNEKLDENGDIIRETWYLLLQGKTEYKISYYRAKEYKFQDDFFVGFYTKRLVQGLRVDFTCPKDIEAMFIPRGTANEFNRITALADVDDQQHNIIIRKYEGLLLYRQGFVISLFKK